MVGTTIALIGLGVTSVASITINIFQGIQNSKLRKQIEMLVQIIQKQQNDINELKKQMKALKLWAFRQRYACRKEIKSVKKDMNSNIIKLYEIKKSLA